MKLILALLVLIMIPMSRLRAAESLDGNATIRGQVGTSEINISTTSRLAGAVHSLSWNGKEFIDSLDHGRQLQSACNLDCATAITNETFNPTEAGSSRDGIGAISSGRLLHLRTDSNVLQSVNQMAFGLTPGEKSGPNLARNSSILSDHLLTKRVRIGYRDLPHVIAYDSIFSVPIGKRHHKATFEMLTGYMPPEFERFLQFNSQSGEMVPLSEGPGEIRQPIVFSVPVGSHAMGIYGPLQTTLNTIGPTYGRFRFTTERVVKWNCVFRVRGKEGISPESVSDVRSGR